MSQMVNFLDPITPVASASLGQVSNNAVEKARISAQARMQAAQIQSQEMIAHAQIDSQETEHAKYQEFLKTQQDTGIAADQARDTARFANDQEMAKQADAQDKRHFEREVDVQSQLQAIHKQELADAAARQVELTKARLPLAREAKELEATRVAAQTAYGMSRSQLDATVAQMGPLIDTSLGTLDKVSDTALVWGEKALVDAERDVNDNMTEMRGKYASTWNQSVYKRVFSATSHVASSKTNRDTIEKNSVRLGGDISNAVRNSVMKSATSSFLQDAHLDQSKRDAFTEMIGLVGESANTLASSTDVSLGNAQKRFKELHDQIVEGDPLKAAEIKHFIASLAGQAKAKAASIKEQVEQKFATGDSNKDAGGTSELIAKQHAFEGLAKFEQFYRTTGVTAPSRQTIALAYSKLRGLSLLGKSKEEIDTALAQDGELNPTTRKHLLRFYDNYGGGAIAAALRSNETAVRKATSQIGENEVQQGLLDQDVIGRQANEDLLKQANRYSGVKVK